MKNLTDILEFNRNCDEIAIRFVNVDRSVEELSYKNLISKINLLKNSLQENVKINNRTCLFALYGTWNRRFYEILLSVVYSKNAYFIIDTEWPVNYVISIVNKIKPDFIILENKKSSDQIAENLLGDYRLNGCFLGNEYKIMANDSQVENVNDLAYVICTSGTTGEAKVIKVLNSSIMPNILQLSKLFDLNQNDVVYQASSLTFDPSLIEIFAAFLVKSTLLILPHLFKLMPKQLVSILKENHVTFMQITPTLFRNLIKISEDIPGTLKCLVLGGESFPHQNKFISEILKRNIKIYNIYGVTELSCWATCHSIDINDLNDEEGVELGNSLKETELYLEIPEQGLVDVKSLEKKSENEKLIGKLYLKSKTRVCYLNDKIKEFIDTGDQVLYHKKKLYYKGRTNKIIKRSGKILNLNLLEKICRYCDFVEDCVSDCIENEGTERLLLFVAAYAYNAELSEVYFKKIMENISNNLPSHYKPDEIIFCDEVLPINRNAKIDLKGLVDKYIVKNKILVESDDNVEKILSNTWKEILHIIPNKNDNFIFSGGTSFKAIQFLEEFERQSKNKFKGYDEKFIDYLLNKTFEDLTELVEKSFVENKDSIKSLKRTFERTEFKAEPLSKKLNIKKSDLVVVSKNKKNQYEDEDILPTFCEETKFKIEFLWKYDTKKCIDATVLYILNNKDENETVFIGSHSYLFASINAKTGEANWEFKAKDRIESSACVSKCENYVIFGSYDKNVYVLDVKSGEIYWCFTTDDVVKCSPTVNYKNGYIYFGSHDKNVYCLDIEKKAVVWKQNLDSTSIFASPTCDEDLNLLFVATLAGSLFCLDSNTGVLIWSEKLGKPCFGTPTISKKRSLIFIGTCEGIFFCHTYEGNLKWSYKTNAPIFSSSCLCLNFILFGSYDNNIYCLEQENGDLLWKYDCQYQIYSTPFIFNIKEEYGIVCSTCNGKILFFNLCGTLIEVYKMNAEIFSSPIFYNSKLYIGCRDDYLYAFSIENSNST